MLLTIGDRAPAFSARTHEGELLTLESLRGRKVLLWFYPKADTPGCTIEGRGFRDQKADFDALGVTVLGASLDDVDENAAFARKHGFPFPLLCDTDRALALAYGAVADAGATHAARVSYLIDEAGRIARVYEQVNPKDHPAKVLLDLIES
jgi:peroxiredoxin Q/BCP